MKQPTPKALSKWFMAQPAGDRTCSGCGVTKDRAYVQPQHPFYCEGEEGVAFCMDCLNRQDKERKVARKAQLAEMPRCEVDGCNRRGSWKVGADKVLVCGRHRKAIEAEVYKTVPAFMGFFGGPINARGYVNRMKKGAKS